MPGLPNQ